MLTHTITCSSLLSILQFLTFYSSVPYFLSVKNLYFSDYLDANLNQFYSLSFFKPAYLIYKINNEFQTVNYNLHLISG